MLRNKYLEGKSDDDFVELMDMWEDLKPIPKEADPDGRLDLMLELNERMEDINPDLKREPIEFMPNTNDFYKKTTIPVSLRSNWHLHLVLTVRSIRRSSMS